MSEAREQWVDADAVARVSGGLPGAVARLCAVLQRTLPPQLAQTRAALNTADLLAIRDAAHTLFATVAAFSIRAGEHVRLLEDAATREDLAGCANLIAELDVICAALIEEVRALPENAKL
jgi:HPt (histidine-containing phosphotransfer) domain-containing protein